MKLNAVPLSGAVCKSDGGPDHRARVVMKELIEERPVSRLGA